MGLAHVKSNVQIQDPVDLATAKLIIEKYRHKCRMQSEQILAWKKAYNLQRQQHYAIGQIKTEQLNALTSQLFLLESRLRRKQRHIANILCETECTIVRQQKIIDTLSSRLVDYKLDSADANSRFSCTDLETNDSDSAVVLEDIDSDSNTNSSIILRRRNVHNSTGGGGGGDVTIVRSISDAIDKHIDSTLNKYLSGGGNINRRSNCYLRRPDILETVYSVEEDPEPDAAEKRDNFKKQSKLSACKTTDDLVDDNHCETVSINVSECVSEPLHNISSCSENMRYPAADKMKSGGSGPQVVVNYNRVMSNHRSVTKPKDVKYKRINKAKSKSLEELRGRLRHWVDKGNIELFDAQKQAHSYV